MPAPLDPVIRKQIKALAEEGYTATAIAERLNLGRHTVARYRNGLMRPQAGATPATRTRQGGAGTVAPVDGELDELRLLVRLFERNACPRCGRHFYNLRGQVAEGVCQWCFTSWSVTPNSQPADSGQ